MKMRQFKLENLERRDLLVVGPFCPQFVPDEIAPELAEAGIIDESPDAQTAFLEQFVMDLVPIANATSTVQQTGDWTDSGTWDTVPSDGANVWVPQGVTLFISSKIAARINWLRVDGELYFDRSATNELLVDTLVVSESGRIDLGTPLVPVVGDTTIKFTDEGAIDTEADPFMLGRGFHVFGEARIHGQSKDAHVAVIDYPLENDTSITVDSAFQWQIGDRVLIPSVTRGNPDEVRIITGFEVQGGNVVLEFNGQDPLEYDHVPVETDIEFQVANLTRTVKFVSENTTDPTRAGHTIYYRGSQTETAYAYYDHIGRTDKSIPTTDPDGNGNGLTNPRARYAIHFHHTGPENAASYVYGNVVENNPGWGYVNHVGNVHFVDNVGYNVKGSHFVTELGPEVGSFVNNMAVRSTDSRYWVPVVNESRNGSGNGFGSLGHGFWIQGAKTPLIGNIASGQVQDAYFLSGKTVSADGRPETGYFDTQNLQPGDLVNSGTQFTNGVANTEPGRLENNVAFASGVGLSIWFHSALPEGIQVDGFVGYNFRWQGIGLGYAWGVHFNHLRVIGGEELLDNPWDISSGIQGNVGTRDITVENAEIRNFDRGIESHPLNNTIVKDSVLDNVIDIYVDKPGTNGIGYRKVLLENISHPASTIRQWKLYLSEDFANGAGTWDYSDPHSINYNGDEVYWYQQAADAIPFPSDNVPGGFSNLPFSDYVDKTQTELQTQYGFVFGGEIAPGTATDGAANGIRGLVEADVDPVYGDPYDFESDALAIPQGRLVVQEGQSKSFYFTIYSADNFGGAQPDWAAYVVSGLTRKEQVISVTPLDNGVFAVKVNIASNLDADRYTLVLTPQIDHEYQPLEVIGVYLGELFVE